jgi:5'-methylthioadenosine phosphorylase
MKEIKTAIIGGSGLYEIEGLKKIDEIKVETPWGLPSDLITISELDGEKIAFLPRHSQGHVFLPHEVNYRANIAALKKIGVKEIFAFSAVGSLKEEIKPLDFVLPNQIIDRTKSRVSSFYGEGVAAHVGFANPFCDRLHKIIEPAAKNLGITLHTKETLICMEGPAFSTKAESNLYRSWGAGVINMSTIPEAKLAREAEICYAVICMGTDYDCWHEEEEDVTIEMVIKNMTTNSSQAKMLIKDLIKKSGQTRDCACEQASKYAVVTAEEKRNLEQVKRLKEIFPYYY